MFGLINNNVYESSYVKPSGSFVELAIRNTHKNLDLEIPEGMLRSVLSLVQVQLKNNINKNALIGFQNNKNLQRKQNISKNK